MLPIDDKHDAACMPFMVDGISLILQVKKDSDEAESAFQLLVNCAVKRVGV